MHPKEEYILTTKCCPAFRYLIEKREQVSGANCPQNLRARRILASQTAALLFIFLCSEPHSDALCHISSNAMWKRLINDSASDWWADLNQGCNQVMRDVGS